MDLIAQALETKNGMISYQVTQEFLNVATRKFLTPMNEQDAKYYLKKVLDPLCQVYPSTEHLEVFERKPREALK